MKVVLIELVCLKTAAIATQQGAQSKLKIKKEKASAPLLNSSEIEFMPPELLAEITSKEFTMFSFANKPEIVAAMVCQLEKPIGLKIGIKNFPICAKIEASGWTMPMVELTNPTFVAIHINILAMKIAVIVFEMKDFILKMESKKMCLRCGSW